MKIYKRAAVVIKNSLFFEQASKRKRKILLLFFHSHSIFIFCVSWCDRQKSATENCKLEISSVGSRFSSIVKFAISMHSGYQATNKTHSPVSTAAVAVTTNWTMNYLLSDDISILLFSFSLAHSPTIANNKNVNEINFLSSSNSIIIENFIIVCTTLSFRWLVKNVYS